QFGDARLAELLEQAEQEGGPVQGSVRRLSHSLMRGRGGATSDDATLFLLEWQGPNGGPPPGGRSGVRSSV
ncbi:MAG: serine/threonine-protein phosphatase, partial [Solirubrobacterales bacterium]